MQCIIVFLTISLIFFVTDVSLLHRNPMLPSIIEEANFDQFYTRSLDSTPEYVFLFLKTKNSYQKEARVTVESDATAEFPLFVDVKQRREIISWEIPLNGNLNYNTTSRTLCLLKSNNSKEEEEFITVSFSTASPVNISFTFSLASVKDFYIRAGEPISITLSPSEPIYYGYSFDKEEICCKSVVVQLESDSDICMIASIQNKSCPVFDLEENVQFSENWQTVSRRGAIAVSTEKYPDGFFVVLVVKNDDHDCTEVPNFVTSREKNLTLSLNPGISSKTYIVASLSVIGIFVPFYIFYIIHICICTRQKMSKEESLTKPGPSQPQKQQSSHGTFEDCSLEMEVVPAKVDITLHDLSRKKSKSLRKKAFSYIYYIGLVAIFYSLPVVQLVLRDQSVPQVTGNHDLCYYNFLCAHPVGNCLDFNHVYSNLGYVLLGLLFILLIFMRDRNNGNTMEDTSYGIPQYYGLFYAMGVALIVEGVLSGSYHICPNKSNFQFDTSFMYIILVICMVKIYQNRHPDMHARAPVAFGVLAITIILALIGVLYNSKLFRIIFSIIHLGGLLLLTVQLYYVGIWEFDRSIFCRTFLRLIKDFACLRFEPLYPKRFWILLIANLSNFGLAVFGIIQAHNDFPTYLLMILMWNLLLYIFFYIIMKICHKEQILLEPRIYICLSSVTWSAAIYFFLEKTTSWVLTPAESRIYNMPCLWLNFFDSHDIWHFFSAFAIFFSFMLLLTIDDDLSNVHRKDIKVF